MPMQLVIGRTNAATVAQDAFTEGPRTGKWQLYLRQCVALCTQSGVSDSRCYLGWNIKSRCAGGAQQLYKQSVAQTHGDAALCKPMCSEVAHAGMFMALDNHAVEQLQHCSPWTDLNTCMHLPAVSVLPGLPCCVPPAACAHRPCVSHVETRPKHAGCCDGRPVEAGVGVEQLRLPQTTAPLSHALFIVVFLLLLAHLVTRALKHTPHFDVLAHSMPSRPERRGTRRRRCQAPTAEQVRAKVPGWNVSTQEGPGCRPRAEGFSFACVAVPRETMPLPPAHICSAIRRKIAARRSRLPRHACRLQERRDMRTSMDGLPCATGEEETQRQAPCQSRGVLHELDWQGRQACWHRPESGMTSSHTPAEALGSAMALGSAKALGSASCSGRKRLRDDGVESLRLVLKWHVAPLQACGCSLGPNHCCPLIAHNADCSDDDGFGDGGSDSGDGLPEGSGSLDGVGGSGVSLNGADLEAIKGEAGSQDAWHHMMVMHPQQMVPVMTDHSAVGVGVMPGVMPGQQVGPGLPLIPLVLAGDAAAQAAAAGQQVVDGNAGGMVPAQGQAGGMPLMTPAAPPEASAVQMTGGHDPMAMAMSVHWVAAQQPQMQAMPNGQAGMGGVAPGHNGMNGGAAGPGGQGKLDGAALQASAAVGGPTAAGGGGLTPAGALTDPSISAAVDAATAAAMAGGADADTAAAMSASIAALMSDPAAAAAAAAAMSDPSNPASMQALAQLAQMQSLGQLPPGAQWAACLGRGPG